MKSIKLKGLGSYKYLSQIELYAPDDESELTTIKDAVIYVGKSYCGIADGKDQSSRRYLIHCPTVRVIC